MEIERFDYAFGQCNECGAAVSFSEEDPYPLCSDCYDADPDKWRPYGFTIVWDGKKTGRLGYRFLMEVSAKEYRYFWECPRKEGPRRIEWARMNWLVWKYTHESLEVHIVNLLNNPYTCFGCFGRTDAQGRCKCQY